MKKHTVGSAHLPHLRRSTRYLLVALFPLLVCWLLFMRQSRDWAMNISEQNAVRMLDKNALLIDQRMNSIERSLYALSNDDRFNDLVASTSYRSSNTYYSNQRKMSPIVSQYFWDFDGFCSFYIVSSDFSDSYYNVSGLPDIISPDDIVQAEAIAAAQKSAVWFPAARYSDVIRSDERYSKYYANFDVISVGRQIDFSYSARGILHRSTDSQDYPILLISLYVSIFDQWLEAEDQLDDTGYRIYTDRFEPVYATSGFGFDGLEERCLPIPPNGSDSRISQWEDDGIRSTFICSRRLGQTDWIITSYTAIDNTFLYFSSRISLISLAVIVMTILLVLVVMRVSMRSVTEPLELLCGGLRQTAKGHYDYRIFSTSYAAYQNTFQAYNSMNEDIKKLIDENYTIKLNEKELEIQMLNLQFNPHFLYNMLNTVSLMALESGQEDVSDMLAKLSYMMRYSVKTQELFVPLREEMHYVEAYIAAMQLRTSCRFAYIAELEPALMGHPVPKFMLQPFVENAIQHGFANRHANPPYTLRIASRTEGDDLLFIVADNGKGLEKQAVETLWKRENSGIGIVNTHKRLQMYYGERYGVSIAAEPGQGTEITIRIPRKDGY